MNRQAMLITGAGSGIGKGLAQLAAADGWQVIVTDLQRRFADETAQAIAAEGGTGPSLRTRRDRSRQHSRGRRRLGRTAPRCADQQRRAPARGQTGEDFPSHQWDYVVTWSCSTALA